MAGRLFKLLSLLLLGWFAFVFGAVAYAKLFGREPVQPAPDADEIDLVATFGPLEYKGTSQAFRGGSITTWFGGGEVDLRGARLAPGGATIRVHALFGGGSLTIPEDWTLETHVVGIGGVGGPATGRAGDAVAPVLRIEGVVVFGGWGILPAPADGASEASGFAAAESAAAEDAAGA
jgi:hypothetical protein